MTWQHRYLIALSRLGCRPRWVSTAARAVPNCGGPTSAHKFVQTSRRVVLWRQWGGAQVVAHETLGFVAGDGCTATPLSIKGKNLVADNALQVAALICLVAQPNIAWGSKKALPVSLAASYTIHMRHDTRACSPNPTLTSAGGKFRHIARIMQCRSDVCRQLLYHAHCQPDAHLPMHLAMHMLAGLFNTSVHRMPQTQEILVADDAITINCHVRSGWIPGEAAGRSAASGQVIVDLQSTAPSSVSAEQKSNECSVLQGKAHVCVPKPGTRQTDRKADMPRLST